MIAALPRLRPLRHVVTAWSPVVVVSAVALGLLLTEPTDYVSSFATVFLGIFFEALPFLLAGVLVSATLQTWAPASVFHRLPTGRVRGALAGVALAAVLPVCECGVAPVARRLLVRGASLPTTLGFLLGGPVVNPIVFAATWAAFGPALAAARVGLSLLVAVGVAWLYGWHPAPRSVVRIGSSASPDDAGAPTGRPARLWARLTETAEVASAELLDMCRLLIVGAAIAALLRTLVPGSALLAVSQEPVLVVGLMMTLAALLSICSVVDAFVALSFSGVVPTGALLAFLVFGPIIDIKSVLLYGAVFRWPTVAVLVLLVTQAVLLIGVVVTLHVG